MPGETPRYVGTADNHSPSSYKCQGKARKHLKSPEPHSLCDRAQARNEKSLLHIRYLQPSVTSRGTGEAEGQGPQGRTRAQGLGMLRCRGEEAALGLALPAHPSCSSVPHSSGLRGNAELHLRVKQRRHKLFEY